MTGTLTVRFADGTTATVDNVPATVYRQAVADLTADGQIVELHWAEVPS